jgi:ATP-dependent protease ClpP protease subunit
VTDEQITYRIYFDGEVDDRKARKTIAELYRASAENPGCDIEFVINSPGGAVVPGTAVYSELYSMSRGGGGEHFVTTKVRGQAASVATLIFQAGDNRVGGELDMLMFHESRISIHGEYLTEVRHRLAVEDSYDQAYNDVFANRSGQSREFIESLCGPKDRVMMMPEAIFHGLADEIG